MEIWREVVRRIARENKGRMVDGYWGRCKSSPALATAAFDTWLADTTLTMSLAAPLFGSLLQDKADLRHTGNVLDALSKNAAMVNSRGDVAACLDNWVALGDDPALSRYSTALRLPEHEGTRKTMACTTGTPASCGYVHRDSPPHPGALITELANPYLMGSAGPLCCQTLWRGRGYNSAI